MTILIQPKKITLLLTLITLFLTIAHIAGKISKYVFGHDNLLGLVSLFNTTMENNIPTWYSSSTLLMCSFLLAVIASANRVANNRHTLEWVALSFIFLLLSLDETASLHERAGQLIATVVGGDGFLYHAWVILGGILVSLFALVFLRFILYLPKRTRFLFVIAGAFYVVGALCMESISGYIVDTIGTENLALEIVSGGEELLEMVGIIIFTHALLSYLSSHVGEVSICVKDKGELAGNLTLQKA